jgi:hypothetical protein
LQFSCWLRLSFINFQSLCIHMGIESEVSGRGSAGVPAQNANPGILEKSALAANGSASAQKQDCGGEAEAVAAAAGIGAFAGAAYFAAKYIVCSEAFCWVMNEAYRHVVYRGMGH